MKVAVVGPGGREHALAHAMSRSASVVVSPGNAGMRWAGIDCAPAVPADTDLVVIGPEAPLVAGEADEYRGRGFAVFGPGRDGARLEGSKAYLKAVMHRAGVPTAASRAFTADELTDAETFLRSLPGLYVIKTDGLAAGKGVRVTTDLDEALEDLRAKLSGTSFGPAGTTVVIEEGMTGPELSILAVCDGRADAGGVVLLPPARDHKRVGDGDTGLNTGGMGAFSPVPDAGDDVS